jgi:hypothetical protein
MYPSPPKNFVENLFSSVNKDLIEKIILSGSDELPISPTE